MVLETLINPVNAERKPWELFFIGAVYSSVAIFLSTIVFRDYAGIVMVFLTTLACSYLIQRMLRMEEKKDTNQIITELHLLKEHGKALTVFILLFLGFVTAFSAWYVVLPSEMTHTIFKVQENTIQCINSGTTQGCMTGMQTGVQSTFSKIFLNNIKVLAFTLIFAFFYGAGAVFILAWNAAVVGTAIGIFVRNSVSTAAVNIGLTSIASYFSIYSIGVLKYMTHGIFEILAYFMAALAGGIISIAVARHNFKSPEFRKVLLDSVDLIALSAGTLFLAAVVEVFITPMLF
ncbi:stage II sporulation protein M [Candidatus Woesearchaeota archaeon]|nr:stage II sporulation protein M [Candidatus Woesearchaeota archaeon]